MDAIELFKKAAAAMQTDERYLALDAARRANDENKELQDMIGEFNLARMDLNNEITKDERDDERIAELMQAAVDAVNKRNPLYKYIRNVKLRKEDFKKTTTQKIKRYLVE